MDGLAFQFSTVRCHRARQSWRQALARPDRLKIATGRCPAAHLVGGSTKIILEAYIALGRPSKVLTRGSDQSAKPTGAPCQSAISCLGHGGRVA